MRWTCARLRRKRSIIHLGISQFVKRTFRMPGRRFVLVAAFVTTLILVAIPGSLTVHAQSARNQSRTAQVPSPQSILGFVPGTERTIADWRQITNYFNKLDRSSASVHVETLGETTLKLPFIVAYISAPENIRQLAKFKAIQRKLADPRSITSETERDQLIREGKTIVAIACSIHSTEIVASQMSMQLAYELATAQDEPTKETLRNTILLLIPSVNPDGVDIVANWYRKTLGTPYEGTSPPEIYHHYAGHDNNRDWFMLNLRETRLVTRLFWKEWFPQIVYDVHQQNEVGPRFFIPPFYDPPNPNIHPILLREIGSIGSKIAADLQAAKFRGVITNAQYDTWWHGGLRTSPYYHNSVGILSEAASAKLMSPTRVSAEQLSKSKSRGMPSALEPATNHPDPWPGGSWGPRQIMEMEMIAARSVLTSAGNYRANYLRNFYELNRSAAIPLTESAQPLAYVIEPGQGNDEALARLIEILVEQGVEVFRMNRELHMTVAGTSSTAAHDVPLGSYVVFLAQPSRPNVKALFERQVYPDRRAANGEAEPPYDVAGWTLPMQMGIETMTVTGIKESEGAARQLTLIKDPLEARRNLGLALGNGEASAVPNPIKKPVRVGLYRGWTGSMDEGWTRWLFDTYNLPYKSMRDSEVREGNLRARYEVIVLPSQRASDILDGNKAGTYPTEFTGGITKEGVENLRRFVEEGGTLVCFDAATELAIKQFDLPLRNVLEGVTRTDFYCPGSVVRLEFGANDPIFSGYRENVDAYFINSVAFESSDTKRVRVAARYARKGLLQSGWLIGEERIAGKIALATVKMGKGNVVLFGFRPQHRGQTWGTFRLIFNAIESGANENL
jgi:hypothetical protein